MKYEDVVEYLNARIETKMAFLEGRRSLYGVDEVARLAQTAFAGEPATTRHAVESIIDSSVASVRKTAQRSAEEQMEDDRKNANVLGVAMMPMVNYARQCAEFIQTREAKRRDTREDLRASVREEVSTWCRSMHRGVWREGEQYQQGVMCTRQGSTWSCQRDGATGKPGESADWVLVVKAGRDGKY